tara:strand:+ start:657 stop:1028 length:372 start_codon:yes stop_codon:yes gene_type:complete
MKNKKLNMLLEAHSDLLNVLVRCRIKIEEREDPTVLDIMTDMRALAGIVTVRQTRPISEIVSSEGHRIVELNVSYIPSFVDSKDVFVSVLKSLKTVDGVYMIKAMEHDDVTLNNRLIKRPLII